LQWNAENAALEKRFNQVSQVCKCKTNEGTKRTLQDVELLSCWRFVSGTLLSSAFQKGSERIVVPRKGICHIVTKPSGRI